MKIIADDREIAVGRSPTGPTRTSVRTHNLTQHYYNFISQKEGIQIGAVMSEWQAFFVSLLCKKISGYWPVPTHRMITGISSTFTKYLLIFLTLEESFVPVLRISRCCSFIQNFPCGQINNSLCQCLPSDVPRKPGVT